MLGEIKNKPIGGCCFLEGPRAVKKEELQQLTDLINYVFRTSSGREADMHISFPLFISEENLNNLLVMVDNGKPVSHMGLWINDFSYFGQPIRVGSLGSVCTDPNYRGQGLATKLMDAVLDHLEAEGVDLLLVSGGRGLYQRAQCFKAGKVTWYNIPKSSSLPRFEIVVNPPVEQLAELWSNEPMHSHRELNNFKALVDAAPLPRCIQHQSAVYLAKIGDVPLAYIQAVNAPNGGVLFYEWAGDRTVLLEIASYISNLPETREVTWPLPSWEKALHNLMPKLDAKVIRTEELSGTYRIIRFAAFIEKINKYLQERYGTNELRGFDEGDMQVLHYLDEELKLDRKSMSDLLFSGLLPENMPPEMKSLFVKAAPLPLPWPIGFDYI